MVDWMVEVLSVMLFDEYLRKTLKAGKSLENCHVHAIGVTCMYLSSKYEDIYPLHSRVVAEKISHNAFSREAILQKEEEFYRLFEFEFNFITPYDVY
jgi:hypothetical protein